MWSIADLERISLSMWNATEEIEYDGWILRFAGGYTGRANSVQTYGGSSLPLPQKLAYCEAMYAERNIPILFKMTSASQPHNLDAFLKSQGYILRNTTSVQLLDMTQDTQRIDDAFTFWVGNAQDGIFPHDIAKWMEHAQRIKQISAKEDASHQAILARLAMPTCYGIIRDTSGDVVGVGICAYDPHEKIGGIFDIAVHPDSRRAGYGRKLTESLLVWGRMQGAQTIFLQVDMSNEKALPLYASLGFTEKYRYWYLHKPD
ncbi:MAG: GNAT family N-acetyltransferase [Anaerolineae bacterium]|jgi:ribosomal protein S18 acetylase RimI-like enzyme|nr:GNAT family N-acetyltransferase [Anaerolineae bacterium]